MAFQPLCIGIAVDDRDVHPSSLARGRSGDRRARQRRRLPRFAEAGPDATFLGSLLGSMLLHTVGLGLCFVPATAAATKDVAHHEAGMLNSARQVGGAIGFGVPSPTATARLDGGAR